MMKILLFSMASLTLASLSALTATQSGLVNSDLLTQIGGSCNCINMANSCTNQGASDECVEARTCADECAGAGATNNSCAGPTEINCEATPFNCPGTDMKCIANPKAGQPGEVSHICQQNGPIVGSFCGTHNACNSGN